MNSELKAVIFSFFTTLGIFLVFVGSSVALTGQSDIRYRAEIVGSVIFVIGLFISIFTIEYSHNTRSKS